MEVLTDLYLRRDVKRDDGVRSGWDAASQLRCWNYDVSVSHAAAVPTATTNDVQSARH